MFVHKEIMSAYEMHLLNLQVLSSRFQLILHLMLLADLRAQMIGHGGKFKPMMAIQVGYQMGDEVDLYFICPF